MRYFVTIGMLVTLATFFIVGVYLVSRDKGDILYFLNKGTENWPQFLHKPIAGCISCMASVWGTLVQLGYYELTGYPPVKSFIIVWLFVTVITAGTSSIVYSIYYHFDITNYINQKVVEKYDNN
jgi:hypothetical protein